MTASEPQRAGADHPAPAEGDGDRQPPAMPGAATDRLSGLFSENVLRTITDNATLALFLMDSEQQCTFMNPAAEQMTGFMFAEVQGRPLHDFVHHTHPDGRPYPLADCPIDRALPTRNRMQGEEVFVHKDGSFYPVAFTASPIVENGTPVGTVIEIEDITEEKRAQGERSRLLAQEQAARERAQAVAEREQQRVRQLRGLARASLAINASLSLDDMLQTITEQARSLVGAHQAVTSFTVDENWAQAITAISLSEQYAAWHSYDTPPDGSGIYALVCRENRAMRMTQAELEAHPAWRGFGAESGRHPPMRGWLAAPLVGRDGRNLGLIQLSDAYDGDFTDEDEAVIVQLAQLAAAAIENARLYRDAQEALHVRDEFLASVTHDLKTPLTSVRGIAQVVRRQVDRGRMPPAEQLAQNMARIDNAVQKMAGLIGDLLDVTRLQTGRPLDLNRAPVDLVVLVRQVAAEYQRSSPRHAITVRSDAAAIVGEWDGERLERVISNLLSNAVKYSREDGPITVTVSRTVDEGQAGDVAEVTVEDRGVGIPASDLPHIFDRFYRAANVVSWMWGSGIGLAGAKQIVEQHGGTITVESTEGKGATFTVHLPIES